MNLTNENPTSRRIRFALTALLIGLGAAGGFALGRHRIRSADGRASNAALPTGHPDIGAAAVPAPPLDDARLASGQASDCPYLSAAARQGKRTAPPPLIKEAGQLPLAQWLNQLDHDNAKGGSHAPASDR